MLQLFHVRYLTLPFFEPDKDDFLGNVQLLLDVCEKVIYLFADIVLSIAWVLDH